MTCWDHTCKHKTCKPELAYGCVFVVSGAHTMPQQDLKKGLLAHRDASSTSAVPPTSAAAEAAHVTRVDVLGLCESPHRASAASQSDAYASALERMDVMGPGFQGTQSRFDDARAFLVSR